VIFVENQITLVFSFFDSRISGNLTFRETGFVVAGARQSSTSVTSYKAEEMSGRTCRLPVLTVVRPMVRPAAGERADHERSADLVYSWLIRSHESVPEGNWMQSRLSLHRRHPRLKRLGFASWQFCPGWSADRFPTDRVSSAWSGWGCA